MAKIMRENRLRERRFDKKAKKEARKLSPVEQPAWDAIPVEELENSSPLAAEDGLLEATASSHADA